MSRGQRLAFLAVAAVVAIVAVIVLRPGSDARQPPVEIACGALGVALLLLVVWSGAAGNQLTTANLAPTFVYVVFWVGLVPVSVVFGDVFRAFNPWRAAGRAIAWAASKGAGEPLTAPLRYPERLGRWRR